MATKIDDQVAAPVAPVDLPKPKSVLDKLRLDGKIAVVTGGARGLGYEMLRAFCQVGAAGIAIFDVLQDHGDQAVELLTKEFGIKVKFYKLDVRDVTAVGQTVAAVVEEFGRIDVALCAAGVVDNIPAEDYPANLFERVMDINVNGVFYTAQAVGKHMIQAKQGGSIIAIASMSGHIVNHPQPQCAYNASKAAVIHLCKSLAAEWAPHKIRVNTISPGYMDTALTKDFNPGQKKIWHERTPLARSGIVDELNGAAVYLASEAASFCTGSDLVIDGGYTAW